MSRWPQEPTDTQLATLRFVHGFSVANKRPPTHAEISRNAGHKSTYAAACLLRVLRKRALVTWENGKRGTLALTAAGVDALKLRAKPLPLPPVAAAARLRPKAIPMPAPAAKASPVAPAKPLRKSMEIAKAEPLPSVVLPVALQTFRGIRHPPMPHGYRKPKGAGDWNFCTTIASMGQVHT